MNGGEAYDAQRPESGTAMWAGAGFERAQVHAVQVHRLKNRWARLAR